MSPLETTLETIASRVRDLREQIGTRWGEHSNRRSVIILLLAGALALHGYLAYVRPPERFPVRELVTIAEGSSLSRTANELTASGVIRSPMALKIIMTAWGKEQQVHAGDYLFKEPLTLFGVARVLSIGAFGLEPVRIRIHEGATVREMAQLFDANLLRFDPDTFVNEALPFEGYLFPDTYFFLPNAREEVVIDAMRQAFELKTEKLMREAASSSRSFEDVMVMASLIEREARNPADRRLISGVLWNRIDKNMLLQVDAAFRYTNGKGTFDLTMKDLLEDSPYNTYQHKGLPPTPIGSPSLDSIDAALHPTKNKYIFYLADNDGVTHYSVTYDEHLKLKKKYLGT